MKKIFLFTILTAGLMACEKTVTVNVPAKPPVLVLHAILEKDDLIQLTVGKSRHILQPLNGGNIPENFTVKNAVPVVYENNIIIDTLIYQPSEYIYKSTRNKTIKAGNTYTIKVTAPGFGEAQTETVVPSQSAIVELKRIKDAKTNSLGISLDEITLKFNDAAGEKNFYLIQIYGYFNGPVPVTVGCVSTTDKDLETYGLEDPTSAENCYDGGKLIMSDANFNGAQKLMKMHVESNYLMDYTAPNGVVYKPFLKLSRITEAHFKYIKSYDVYFNTNGNPFAEPVNVYSNVKNGYGIFSAYTVTTENLD